MTDDAKAPAAENDMVEIEAFVIVDEDGNYDVGADQDSAQTRFDENIGSSSSPRRIINVQIKMPKPTAIVVKVELPGEPAPTSVQVK